MNWFRAGQRDDRRSVKFLANLPSLEVLLLHNGRVVEEELDLLDRAARLHTIRFRHTGIAPLDETDRAAAVTFLLSHPAWSMHIYGEFGTLEFSRPLNNR